MCTQEEDCSCLLTPKSKKEERISQCVKCQGPPAVLIRKDDPALCRSCFISSCLHKINSAFGKYGLNSGGSSVAVAFSGGQNSAALLKLILESFNAAKKTRFTPKVFHLTEYQECQSDLDLIVDVMKGTGFEYHIMPSDENYRNDLFQSKMTSSMLSSKQRYEDYSRLSLLVDCARRLDCKFLLLGECGNRITVKYLQEIVEGRGNHSSIQTSFLDERFKDVTIVRPLRDFLAKELALFAHFMCVKPMTPNDPLTSIMLQNPSVNTLERLTQDFLASLQAGGFPSTTGTILKTSSKIVLTDDAETACTFCHYPVYKTSSYDDPDRLATESIKHSASLSSANGHTKETVLKTDNDESLCSSCSLMFKELSVCT
ncbi:unnamed protein product [Trichobilharzia szidati]|nr:unnamed protein product [Trichobilharzia szidati]